MKGLNKYTSKFVMDMEYWLAKSKSVLLSNVARSLEENNDLDNTIERLSDNLVLLSNEEKEKQSISVYSEIYSCKSKEFVSKNKYTLESIDTVRKGLNRKYF